MTPRLLTIQMGLFLTQVISRGSNMGSNGESGPLIWDLLFMSDQLHQCHFMMNGLGFSFLFSFFSKWLPIDSKRA